MTIHLACITPAPRRIRSEPAFTLVQDYLTRANYYEPSSFEAFAEESALLNAINRRSHGRARASLLLFDSLGKSFTSQQFAAHLGRLRDSGQQHIFAAIGPADGWSAAAHTRADFVLSLGPMTLPHALAQVVVAEQIYRALTILAGHPYHCGH